MCPKNTQNRAKKSSEIKNFEEDRRRKYTTFIPTNSNDYRNDGDIADEDDEFAADLRPRFDGLRRLTHVHQNIRPHPVVGARTIDILDFGVVFATNCRTHP